MTELRAILTEHEIECDDRTRSAVIRSSIWQHFGDNLELQETEIDVSKEDAKNIWEQLRKYLPLYTLFQSDRGNSDTDNEVQDPMKIAVREILNDPDLSERLNVIADEIKAKLDEVSDRTLDKLNEMNPDIANSLAPVIPDSDKLKWSDVFKNVSITGDKDIPINKRGSGVKRLVLLNFFRAEAERRREADNSPSIIYAVEEPETSQHQDHQRRLIAAFRVLATTEQTQVFLTTHSPAIVKLLDFEDLHLVRGAAQKEVVDVQRSTLCYPSLNEVNYLAFGESDEEYHNELYGYIEAEGLLVDFKTNKQQFDYIRLNMDGTTSNERKIRTEIIRHQIHHPENTHNERFSHDELQASIYEMREFIESQK